MGSVSAGRIIATVIAANLVVLVAIIALLAIFSPGLPVTIVYGHLLGLLIVAGFLGAIFWRQ